MQLNTNTIIYTVIRQGLKYSPKNFFIMVVVLLFSLLEFVYSKLGMLQNYTLNFNHN